MAHSRSTASLLFYLPCLCLTVVFSVVSLYSETWWVWSGSGKGEIGMGKDGKRRSGLGRGHVGCYQCEYMDHTEREEQACDVVGVDWEVKRWDGWNREEMVPEIFFFSHLVKGAGSSVSKLLQHIYGDKVCPGSAMSSEVRFPGSVGRQDVVAVSWSPPVVRTDAGDFIQIEIGEGERGDGKLRKWLKSSGEHAVRSPFRKRFRDPMMVDPSIWKECDVLFGHAGSSYIRRLPINARLLTTIRNPFKWRMSVWASGMFHASKKHAHYAAIDFFASFPPNFQLDFHLGMDKGYFGGTHLPSPLLQQSQSLSNSELVEAATRVLTQSAWFGIVDDNHWDTSICLLYHTLGISHHTHPYISSEASVIRHPDPSPPAPHILRAASGSIGDAEWCVYGRAEQILKRRLQAAHATDPSMSWLPDVCTAALRNEGIVKEGAK